MGAALLNKASQLMCPHGGTVTIITSNSRAKASGDFLVRASDTFTIAGCPLIVSGVAHPCVKVTWVQPAGRSKTVSDANLTEQSTGLCVAADQAAQGTVQIVFSQPRVKGL